MGDDVGLGGIAAEALQALATGVVDVGVALPQLTCNNGWVV